MLNLGSVFLYSHVEAKPQSFVVIVLCQFWCSLVFPTLFTITKRLYRDVTEEGKLLPRRKRSVPSKLREGLRLWLQGFPTCFFIGLFSMVMMELRTWSSTHWHWIIVGGGGVKFTLQCMLRVAAARFNLSPNFVENTFIVIGIGMDAQIRLAVMDFDALGDMPLDHVWMGSLIVMVLEFLSRVLSAWWFTRLLQRRQAHPQALEKLHWLHSADLFGNMVGEYGAITCSILLQEASSDNLAQVVYSALIQIGVELGVDALSMLIEDRLGIRIDSFLKDRVAIGIAIITTTACTSGMVVIGLYLLT